MDDPLQHDPRTKQQIKDAIHGFLYAPLIQQFQHRLDDIIVKNCVLLGNSEKSFIYKGERYSSLNTALPLKMNRLHKQLHVPMDEYLRDLRQLNNYELPYVLGFIGQVLNASNHVHDYLRVLPSAVHRPVEQLIESCPCRSVKLTQEGIEALQSKNKIPIDLMKQRMVINLLI